MPDVTIVYWRDIPAQVIVGKGRRGAKRQLEERFEQAIDRAAMKVNAKDSDAYLAEWRKAAPFSVEGVEIARNCVVHLCLRRVSPARNQPLEDLVSGLSVAF